MTGTGSAKQQAPPRWHAAVVGIAVALHLVHQWTYRNWFIDDAAISFAYAQNLVAGEGLVAVPGGERIEGYSNPLWVAIIAVPQVLGIDGFTSAKWITALLGSVAIVQAWKLARRALPDEGGPGPVIAPLILGLSAHHAIWSASALENSLFNVLVMGGLLALLDDADTRRFPRSALWFLGVGLTRPEGVLYAAVAGAWFAVFTLRAGRGLGPAIRWFFGYWLPYGAFLLWRLWYFAFPLPNTYYAKLITQGSFPWRWYARGWAQIRDYADRLWIGFQLPLVLLGLLGPARKRLLVGTVALLGLFLMVPGPEWAQALWFWPDLPDPIPWIRARIALIALAAVILPFFALGQPGGRARILAWAMASVAVAFSVISNGDWMDGLRWMSLFQPELAVLLAVGAVEVARRVASALDEPVWGRAGAAIGALAIGVHVAPNASFSDWYQDHWDDYPEMIFPRVQMSERFARTVFLEEPLKPLDMDMGAHLMWSEQRPVDMAGLVDIPMSLHHYGQRPFIEEYVFEEERPHVAHVHLRWAEISGFLTYPQWSEQYFRYTGYREGDWYHGGLYGRRDLVMNADGVDPKDRTGFARGVVLRGLDLPSPEAGAGRRLFVDTSWSTRFDRAEDDPFTVTAFLHRNGRVHSWDLPMGYTLDGHQLIPPQNWRPDEVFRGQFTLRLPADLEHGAWDLGFVVRGARGYVLRAGGIDTDPQPVASGALVGGRDAPPVLAHGEIRFPGVVQVVPPDGAVAAADTDRIAALEHAWEGRCRPAEEAWIRAKRHVPLDEGYHERHEPEIAGALAECWAEWSLEDPALAPIRLARAHRWDHRNRRFLELREPVADRLWAEGMAAREAGDHQTAYARFRDLLALAPDRSWARRYAEEARDHRLGLGED